MRKKHFSRGIRQISLAAMWRVHWRGQDSGWEDQIMEVKDGSHLDKDIAVRVTELKAF